MLPKHNRIPTYLLKNTPPFRFVHHPLFSVKLRKNDLDAFRFGFVISKRVDKRAVVRNAIKRRMQAALLSFSFPSVGHDIIFFLKKEAVGLSSTEFQKTLEQLFTKEQLL